MVGNLRMLVALGIQQALHKHLWTDCHMAPTRYQPGDGGEGAPCRAHELDKVIRVLPHLLGTLKVKVLGPEKLSVSGKARRPCGGGGGLSGRAKALPSPQQLSPLPWGRGRNGSLSVSGRTGQRTAPQMTPPAPVESVPSAPTAPTPSGHASSHL